MASRPSLRAKLRERQGGKCCYCQVQMTPPISVTRKRKPLPTTETIEHLHLRKFGGGNHHDNIALACHRCNTERGAVDWMTYATYRRGELWEAA